jgi:hypothetical protein
MESAAEAGGGTTAHGVGRGPRRPAARSESSSRSSASSDACHWTRLLSLCRLPAGYGDRGRRGPASSARTAPGARGAIWRACAGLTRRGRAMGSKRDTVREKKPQGKQAQGPEDEYAGIACTGSMRGGFKRRGGRRRQEGHMTRAVKIKDVVIGRDSPRCWCGALLPIRMGGGPAPAARRPVDSRAVRGMSVARGPWELRALTARRWPGLEPGTASRLVAWPTCTPPVLVRLGSGCCSRGSPMGVRRRVQRSWRRAFMARTRAGQVGTHGASCAPSRRPARVRSFEGWSASSGRAPLAVRAQAQRGGHAPSCSTRCATACWTATAAAARTWIHLPAASSATRPAGCTPPRTGRDDGPAPRGWARSSRWPRARRRGSPTS